MGKQSKMPKNISLFASICILELVVISKQSNKILQKYVRLSLCNSSPYRSIQACYHSWQAM